MLESSGVTAMLNVYWMLLVFIVSQTSCFSFVIHVQCLLLAAPVLLYVIVVCTSTDSCVSIRRYWGLKGRSLEVTTYATILSYLRLPSESSSCVRYECVGYDLGVCSLFRARDPHFQHSR